MPKKAEHTIHIHEGEATLYQRAGSPHWQLRYKANSKWTRSTTKKTKLADAKREAMEIIVRARVLEREGLLVTSKRVTTVARLAIKRMQAELDSGNGKVTYKRYIQAINGYIIPLLGSHNIDKIDYATLADFDRQRKERMNHNRKEPIEPSQAVINTHNVAFNRVFDEALLRGFMTKVQVPHLENKGVSSDRRPSFLLKEYKTILNKLRDWIQTARQGNEIKVRTTLYNYILILANTGIRAGTESMNLKWQHIGYENVNGQVMLTMYVKGKTSGRTIYVPTLVAKCLTRIKDLDEDLRKYSFEQLINKKVDKFVFRHEDLSPDSAQSKYGRMFARFLSLPNVNLLKDKDSNTERTLYSLRHFYATKMIVRGAVTEIQLAKHMGTSTTMINKHYEHLKLRDVAHKFVGK
ncbi:site-specific integrase [Polynucleobacter rarus]|uniref:site-specific integrase n=1 Tax=Polynucleobacter rarus TaxID=556055 RepID=UPI000D3E06F7|nr:site-specific integrase [Polynucleobacter rarus]